MRQMRLDILASRELSWRLFLRNLNARYRQTLLGCLWAFLPPVITTLVFVHLHHAGYFSVGGMQVPYVVFVLAGLVLWQVFTDAVNAPLRLVQQSFAMLSKVNFPREALILAGLGEVLFGFFIRALLLAVVMIWYGVPTGWGIVGVVVGVLFLAAMGLTLGLLLTPISLLFHDIGQGLPYVLNLWMFLTPVLYPAPQAGMAYWPMVVNPVAPILDTTRAWLFVSTPQYLGLFVGVGALTLLCLVLGWLVYRLALPIVIERAAA